MSATILDVSRHCNFSPNIVRRVLSAANSDISEDTRKLILRTASELDYRALPHTHSLGVLFMDESAKGLTHPFFASVLNAFKLAAEARGYDVTFINHNIGGARMSYLEYCQYRALAGVCIACIDFSDPEVEALVRSGIPCVTVDHIFKKVPSVLSDNEIGVQKLVLYAIAKGHRRIAMIHGHNNSVVTRTRIKQFRQTMQFSGLPIPDEYLRSGLYGDIPLTRRLVDELLRLPERPTCIFLPDDVTYLGAHEAAQSLGLRVPEDVSFIGYDGLPITQALSPKLTTVRQNSDGIGSEAAAKLISIIENPDDVSFLPILLPVELLEGGTVGTVE